jgi:DUF4097 and DUF4098 domain-containing protein YvlB
VKRFSQFVGALAAVAFLCSATFAEERVYREGNSWVQELTGSLAASKILKVKVEMGGVRVQGGNPDGIRYTVHNRVYVSSEKEARRMFERYHITSGSNGQVAWLVGDWEGSSPRKFSAEFVFEVPRELENVKVETQGGEVSASDLTGNVASSSGGGNVHFGAIGGSVSVETGGGNVDVKHAGGALRVETGGGNVDLGEIGGAAIVETGGGNIRLASAGGPVSIETGGGNIHTGPCPTVKASTGGGLIDLGDIKGPVTIDTGGGSIRLLSAGGLVHAESGAGQLDLGRISDGIRAETGGGGITAQLVSGSLRTDSTLETPAGDIILYLSPDVHATVRAAIEVAQGHRITSDFPEIRITSEGSDWGPKTYVAEGRINGGGPVLKIRTTTGNIELRRLNHYWENRNEQSIFDSGSVGASIALYAGRR